MDDGYFPSEVDALHREWRWVTCGIGMARCGPEALKPDSGSKSIPAGASIAWEAINLIVFNHLPSA
jgi:hypothetical protein